MPPARAPVDLRPHAHPPLDGVTWERRATSAASSSHWRRTPPTTRTGSAPTGAARKASWDRPGAQVVTLDGEPVLLAAAVEADGLAGERRAAVGARDLAPTKIDRAAVCPVRYVVLDTGPSRATLATAPFGTSGAGT